MKLAKTTRSAPTQRWSNSRKSKPGMRSTEGRKTCLRANSASCGTPVPMGVFMTFFGWRSGAYFSGRAMTVRISEQSCSHTNGGTDPRGRTTYKGLTRDV